VNVVCCQVGSLRQADHSSRGVVPSVMCLHEYHLEAPTLSRPRRHKELPQCDSIRKAASDQY
jgi:hypothetical protein